MISRAGSPVAHREGVGRTADKPPAVRPRSFRFLEDIDGFGIVVEEIDGVRHARPARFFRIER